MQHSPGPLAEKVHILSVLPTTSRAILRACVGNANALPVSWVRVDPQAELLAQIQVLQPSVFWGAQLDFSRDVAAQAAAVVGLASERPFSYRSLNTLFACLSNPRVYCRFD